MGVVCCEHDECVLDGRNVEGVLNDVIQNSDLLQCPPRIIVVVGVVYAARCVRAGRSKLTMSHGRTHQII
ncbi:hypothetical protein E2C01_029245 [Portunus trituberculatus]|uniref:Uncharacterized protein n=1 Tax=Portunus trituberculatus TaxID=210409 RepID=A0A5B7ERA2_PORTR|nr:hypothetical protein [Portunus trituberculatus]